MATVSNEDLYNILSELKIIDSKQLESCIKESNFTNVPLGKILIDKDLVSDENLGKILADLLKVPFVNLSLISIPEEVLKIIPEIVAKKHQVIAFKIDTQGLYLATSDPSETQMLDFIAKKSGLPVIVYYATVSDIDNAFSLYTQNVNQAFDEIINENIKQAKGSEAAEPPIIKIVDTIISYAYQNKASDIHIEPTEDHVLVRFRIDGVLHDIVKLPLDIHPRVVSRVKVLAKLRTDEHQAAQDGKLVFKTDSTSNNGENLDLRVSIVPITKGEKIVMRLLSERSRQFSLTGLGFSQTDLEKVKAAYQKPFGMILSTGPTGSGKTTSLYAVLKLLNQRNVNVMTIEDPVEYDIENVNQIQVNAKTNLTFAAGLRSIVRQDPDIILVGEIRDEETADIAINSAMTGHLVLSTLHTNDAATAIPRLLDMKIEPFLIASTVNVIIGQRLIRKICTKCRLSVDLSDFKQFSDLSPDVIKKHFGGPSTGKTGKKSIRVFKGKGCPICHQTGYTGRIGIFEVLLVDDKIREAIVSRKDASTIRDLAIKNGMTTMLDDGLEKVKEGITTIEEVVRVTKE